MVMFKVTPGTSSGLKITSVGGRPRQYKAVDPAWAAGYARYASLISDWSIAWDAIAESFRKAMQEQFDSEGRRLSGGWAPLTPVYAAWKASHFPGQSILRLTGALESAAVNPSVAIGPKRLDITILDPKYSWHQQGTPYMEARQLIGSFPADLMAEWETIGVAFLRLCAEKAWT